MSRCILLLINSRSGKGKAMALAATAEAELSGRNINFKKSIDDWPATLTECSEVWLFGGDGTVNYFINRYPRSEIPLAIFKGGTGNDLSWKLYGDISPQEQISLVLQASSKKTDLGSCNGRLYANSLGIGFDGEVLRSMDTVRWLGGHLGYLFVVIKKIFSFKEFSFRVTAGEKTLNKKFLLVIVNNSSRTGGGFMVSPKASLTDGKLDMVLCEQLPVLKRLRYLPVIEKGKHLELPFIHYSHEDSVKIECDKELYAQIDGELISGSSFDIKVMKEGLNILF